MLYVFRGFSGVANGGVASLSAMVVSDIVTLEDRGKWQGIIGAFVGIGNMVGPFIAAAFVQNSTWRGFFWAVSPFTVVCGFLCLWLLPKSKNRPKMDFQQEMKKVDFGGIFFAGAALIMILIPVAGGGDYFDWDSPMVIGMLTAGGICLLAFIYIERSVALLPMMPRTYPLMPVHIRKLTRMKTVSLFKNIPVAAMLLQNFLFGIVAHSQTYYLPLFFQNAQRRSPIQAACLMLPLSAFQATASILSGQYISRRKRYGEVIWLGFFLWTIGAGLTCMFGADTPIYTIAPVLGVTGVGIGMVFQPVLIAMQAHCLKSQRAVVISNRNFIRSLGGAVGLAISAAVLQNSLYKAMPEEFRNTMSSFETPDFKKLGETEARMIVIAYATASRTVFYMNVPLIGVCFIACLLIKDRGLQRPDEVEVNGEKRREQRDSGSEQSNILELVEVAEADKESLGGRGRQEHRMSGVTL